MSGSVGSSDSHRRLVLAAMIFTLPPMLTGPGREHHGQIMREAARLADPGRLRPRLDPRRFTLETAA
jgi:hypothetical protein